MTKLPFHVQVQ